MKVCYIAVVSLNKTIKIELFTRTKSHRVQINLILVEVPNSLLMVGAEGRKDLPSRLILPFVT